MNFRGLLITLAALFLFAPTCFGAACVRCDNACILTTSYDKTAKIWDASTGEEILTLKGHTDWVNSADFSPDGAKIVTTSYDSTAKIWDVSTGDCIYTLEGHTDWVNSAVFSPCHRSR